MAKPTISIGGVDRSDKVQFGSLRIDQVLTSQVDKCTFRLRKHPGQTYVPTVGQTVVVSESGSTVFGGVIIQIERADISYPLDEITVQCVDYTRFLSRRLAAETYENLTAAEIIRDLVSKYVGDSITTVNVDCPVVIGYIQFNYEAIDRCIKRLAEITGYDWYLDYDKDLHFFTASGVAAPITVQDDNGSYLQGTLFVREDNSQIRNTIIVRGGEYLGSTYSAEMEGDGTTDVFPLPYRFDAINVTVSGSHYNVGRDGSSDPEDYDLIWNRDEKHIKFRASKVPTTGTPITVYGQPYLPVLVKERSWSSINDTSSAEGGNGQYEYLVVDKNINSKEGARARARAEILQLAATLVEGEFETEITGFRPGQRVTVNSASLGINKDFIVNRVTYQQKTYNQFSFHIGLVSTKTMDYINLMRRLLEQSARDVRVQERETLDLIESIQEEAEGSESITATVSHYSVHESASGSETVTVRALNYAIDFVWGAGDATDVPTGTNRVGVWDESYWEDV